MNIPFTDRLSLQFEYSQQRSHLDRDSAASSSAPYATAPGRFQPTTGWQFVCRLVFDTAFSKARNFQCIGLVATENCRSNVEGGRGGVDVVFEGSCPISAFDHDRQTDISGWNNPSNMILVTHRFKTHRIIARVLDAAVHSVIDLKKAFDAVEIEAIMETLYNQGIPPPYVRIIRDLYSNFTTKISQEEILYNDVTIEVKRGVRQGDTISPKIFSATLENAMRGLEWDNIKSIINNIRSSAEPREDYVYEEQTSLKCPIHAQRNEYIRMLQLCVSSSGYQHDERPDLQAGRRERAALRAYKSTEVAVKRTKNFRLSPHLHATPSIERSQPAKKIKYDVLGLTETRRRHPLNAVYETGEELFLGTCDSRGVGGVGVLANTSMAKNIDSFEQLTTRIRRLRMRRCGPTPALTIFVAYAPISSYKEEEVEDFYMDLEKFYREDHAFYKVIIGHFNAKGIMTTKTSSLHWTWKSPEDTAIDNIDEEYDRLVEHLHDCAKKAESFKTTKRCLSLETLELIRQRGAAGNQELTSELARLCREAIKEDLKERRAEVLAEAAEAGKSIRYARRDIASRKIRMTALRNPKGTTIASRRGMEKIIYDFYLDLFESHVHLPPQHLREDGYVIPEVLPSEIRHAIMSAKNRTAPGSDRIRREQLKNLPPLLINTLAMLFTRYLLECKVPKQWKTSKTVLLYKKGDPHDIGNYRQICLLSVIYKLFTRVVLNRIEKVLDEDSHASKQGFEKDSARLTTFTLFRNSSSAKVGVKVDGRQLHRFADDIVLITPSISQAELMLTEIDETCGCIGLQLNLQKTMFMRNGWVSDAPFTLNGTNISKCTRHVYLGREMNMMNKLTPELGRRRRTYKSIEDVVKKTRNIRLRAHLFNTSCFEQCFGNLGIS
ncbi:hypothetical protein RB195_004028 [Necator americanus]|uniref:Reverse transcriptase domain-containing protein n=1 Tax=Necator americanus TaxID=51031 RepID=A0ABR1BK03_NECAM